MAALSLHNVLLWLNLLLWLLLLLLKWWEKQPPWKQVELLRKLYSLLYKLPQPKRWKQRLFLKLLSL